MKRNEMLLAAFVAAVIALAVYLSTSAPPSSPAVAENSDTKQKKDIYNVDRSVTPTLNSSAAKK